MAKTTATLAGWLAALADPTRINILRELTRGSRNVTNLAQALNVEIVNVSHHLRVLLGDGVVQNERHGRFVIYTLAPGAEVLAGSGVLRLRHAPTGAVLDIPQAAAPAPTPSS